MARKHKTKIAQPSQYPQQCPQQIEMVTEDQLVARLGTHGHTVTQHWTTVVQMILPCEMCDSQVGVHKGQFSAVNVSFNLSFHLVLKFYFNLKSQVRSAVGEHNMLSVLKLWSFFSLDLKFYLQTS